MDRDLLSKNSHKFQIILSSRNSCSFAVKSFMMVAIAGSYHKRPNTSDLATRYCRVTLVSFQIINVFNTTF